MFSPKSKVDKLRQVESPSLRRRSLQLPTPLRCEVRSPGFSSRLSTLIRENEAGTQQKNAKKALQPPLAAAAFNPKYQGFGSMPRVKLERRSLPRLAMKNSPSSVKSPMGYGVTTVKVAPAEPFSPFRSNNTSLNSTPISSENNVADPRRVLAALQELSRSRKRGRHQRRIAEEEDEDDDDEEDDDDDDDDDEEDEEEHGSKRARRDSSSSLGSSLSMEMPPLFSNGVVGQTTSHLVSRETDLSLNSLLSRSQSIFGHANQASTTTASSSQSQAQHHNHKLPTIQTSQISSQRRNTNQKTVVNEAQSSLSSSIHMLKRRRESSSDSSDSYDDDVQEYGDESTNTKISNISGKYFYVNSQYDM